MKFEGTTYAEEIRVVDAHPATAKKMGQTRRVPLRADWEKVKEPIMVEALVAKFTQHAALGTLLRKTGNRLLVERTANDRYWGDGGDYTGKNRLGYCLMVVRQQLQRAAVQPTSASADVPALSAAASTTTTSTTTATATATATSPVDVGLEPSPPVGTEAPTLAVVGTDREARPVRRGKKKGQRKRSVYLDADGTPVFDKSSSTTVRVAGTRMDINARALPAAARLVVHQFQHTKKREGLNSDEFYSDDEEEEDDEYEEEEQEEEEEAAAEESAAGEAQLTAGGAAHSRRPSHAHPRSGATFGDFLGSVAVASTEFESALAKLTGLLAFWKDLDPGMKFDPTMQADFKAQWSPVANTFGEWIEHRRLSDAQTASALALLDQCPQE